MRKTVTLTKTTIFLGFGLSLSTTMACGDEGTDPSPFVGEASEVVDGFEGAAAGGQTFSETECTAGEAMNCGCASDEGVRSCRSDGTWGCCHCPAATEVDDLSCTQVGIVGYWTGFASAPGRPSYRVELSLGADGVYEVSCPAFGNSGPGLCHYNGDTPLTYEVTRLSDDGGHAGRIEERPGSWAFISRLRLSDDDESLSFQVINASGSAIGTSFSLNRVRF